MKTMYKHFLASLIFILVFSVCVTPIFAANLGLSFANNLDLEVQNGDVRDAAVSIIKYLMTFLGLIAVVIILYGGFQWLTAAGNEDRISKAKSTIMAGMIGLVIILAAFAIVTFVIQITQNSLI